VHHTNEIAQSEAATGKQPFVRYWLHSEFLIAKSGEKMSKSLGNIVDLDTLQESGVEPLAFRYLCLGASYSAKLQLGEDSLRGAQTSYDALKSAIAETRKDIMPEEETKLGELGNQYLRNFTTVIADNLNTPRALAVLWTMLKDKQLPKEEKYYLALKFDEVFGLGLNNPNQSRETAMPTEISVLITERDKSRQDKDWKQADLLRSKIVDAGYELFDTPSGTIVKKK
jgi:cysteinyl-tRNA synthetase